MSGTASKGLIQNGMVSICAIDAGGQKGSLLATAQTDGNGQYSVNITHSGPVLVEITGGTYVDDATGQTTPLSGVLRAALPSVSGDVDVAVTPLTELAAHLAETNGFTTEKINASNALLAQLIGCSVIDTQPADPRSPGAFGSANADQQNYALFLAILSQMADNRSLDIFEALDALEQDLLDLELDNTGLELQDALADFLANADNHTGATAAEALQTLIAAILGEGLAPTGSLAELKTLLAAFMNDPSESNYNAFMNYMHTFAPNSQEARLYTAMATLMSIYSHDAFDLITDATGGLGINFATDWETYDPAQALGNLMDSSTLDADVTVMYAEMEARLDSVYADLNQAAGINANISLTGFDMVYIDDIDVNVLKAITQFFKAVCIFIQSINLTATNWEVTPLAGQPTDARDILRSGQSLTPGQRIELLNNNQTFFAYKDTAKLAEFQTTLAAALADLQAAVTALENLGDSGRSQRHQNAFNLDSEYDLYQMKAVSEGFLPSLLAAFGNADASIQTPESEMTGGAILDGGDGYSYVQRIYDIYLVNQDPAPGHITLHELMAPTQAPRDLLLAMFAAEQAEVDYNTPYAEGTRNIFQSSVTDTDWDDPITSCTLPAAAIAIDGSKADWAGVPALFTDGSGLEFKIAAGQGNTYYILLSNPNGLGIPTVDSFYYYMYLSAYQPWDFYDFNPAPDYYSAQLGYYSSSGTSSH